MTPTFSPQLLERMRNGDGKQPGVSDETTVQIYSSQKTPEAQAFKSKYEQMLQAPDHFQYFDPNTGLKIPLATAALNYEAYGNPYGKNGRTDSPTAPQKEKGLLQSLGETITAPGELATGVALKGMGVAASGAGSAAKAIGLKGIGQGLQNFGNLSQNSTEARNIGKNASNVVENLPMYGMMVAPELAPELGLGGLGMASKPLAAGIGAATGQAGKEVIQDLQGKNPNAPAQQIGNTAIQGGLGAAAEFGGNMIGKGIGIGVPFLRRFLTARGADLTNIDYPVMERAYKFAAPMTEAISKVAKNPTQPFFSLAKEVHGALTSMMDSASKAITSAKDAFTETYPKAKFNVAVTMDQINAALKDAGINLTVKQDNLLEKGPIFLENGLLDLGSLGKTSPTSLGQGQVKPLAASEGNKILTVMKKMMGAKDFSLGDILDMKTLFKEMYNEVPLAETGNGAGKPTYYHKILMTLKNVMDGISTESLPDQLKTAYQQYAKAATADELFGKFFIHPKDPSLVADGAETYLMKVNALNKGARAEAFNKLSEFIGMDVGTKAQFLSDAGKLMNVFPKTGSREKDNLLTMAIIGASRAGRALMTYGGVGETLGAPKAILAGGMGAAMTAATSPLVVGKITRMAGELAANKITQGIGTAISTLSPLGKAFLYDTLNQIFQYETSSEKQRQSKK